MQREICKIDGCTNLVRPKGKIDGIQTYKKTCRFHHEDGTPRFHRRGKKTTISSMIRFNKIMSNKNTRTLEYKFTPEEAEEFEKEVILQRENKWQDRAKEQIGVMFGKDKIDSFKLEKILSFIQSEIDRVQEETLKGQVYTKVKVTEEYEIPEHIVKTIRDTARAEERGRVVEALKKSLKEEQKYLILESSYGEGVYEGLVHSIHLVETLNK